MGGSTGTVRYGHLGPTVARRVRGGGVDCPWRLERVAFADCERCGRLVALEREGTTLTVHCRCPQSDALNDPAWRHAV